MDVSEQSKGSHFSITTALVLFTLAVVFNYLAIVLSSVMYGDAGPAAFSFVSIIGGNMLFFGLPYSLSVLYVAVCSWVMYRFFPSHVGDTSVIHSWGTILLAALASYGILSLPSLFWSGGTHGLGMMVIMLIRNMVL